MDEVETKLMSCFSAVLPELTVGEIAQATATTVRSWDSVATVSLIAVIEEEFGIAIDTEALSNFDSFQGILGYLRDSCPQRQSVVDLA